MNPYLLVANTGDRNLALEIVHKSQAVKLVEEKHRKVIRENGICEVFFLKQLEFFFGFLYKHDNLDSTGTDGVLENVGVEDGEAAGPSGELK